MHVEINAFASASYDLMIPWTRGPKGGVLCPKPVELQHEAEIATFMDSLILIFWQL